jgi:hypothetical protein
MKSADNDIQKARRSTELIIGNFDHLTISLY